MGSTPRKRWYFPGCKGSFYTRGKNNIIWYYNNGIRRSTGLQYSPTNRVIAGQEQAQKELRIKLSPEKKRIKTLGTAFNYFLDKTSHNKSKGTVDHYKNSFRAFFPDPDILLIEDDIIKANIKNKLNSGKLSRITLKNYLVDIKAFFKFLKDEGIIDEVPITKQDIPKVPHKPIEIFTQSELEKILTYWESKDLRFYCFFRFIYKTAFRYNEAITLKWWQVKIGEEWRDKIILKKSKYGNIEEYFPLTDGIKEILNDIPDKDQDKVFPWELSSKSYINRKFKNSLKELSIPIKTMDHAGYGRNIHILRKTRITEWIKQGISVSGLEKLSRDNYQTLKRYYNAVETSDYTKFID